MNMATGFTIFIRSLNVFFILIMCLGHCKGGIPYAITDLGMVIGDIHRFNMKETMYSVHMFRGIPYAKPPIGDLRFKKPQPVDKFDTDVFEAFEYGAGCPQVELAEAPLPKMKTNEDCLFLNIVLPLQESDKPTGHAVMVFIHGGGFIMGTGSSYVSNTLASVGNVIVVTFNYRIGLYGFFSTGDEHAPGNMGLWDQQLALQWVNKNIGAFGGDNNRVTIFGESAGAISVFLQGLHYPNNGLFQRIIAESGTPTMAGMIADDPLTAATFFAEKIGCNTSRSETITRCLRQTDSETIMATFQNLMTELDNILKLGLPTIDNDFIKDNPNVLTQKANEGNIKEVEFFRSLDLINGVNGYEGAVGLGMITGTDDIETFKPTMEMMRSNLVPTALLIAYGYQLPDAVTEMVMSEYTDWNSPNDFERLRDQFVKLMGDIEFSVPLIEFTRLHSNSSDVNSYAYKFMPKPTTRMMPTPSWVEGASHADELGFVFGFDKEMRAALTTDALVDPEEWEYDLSFAVMTYWTNFAKTGDPNTPLKVDTMWPKYNLNTQKYIEFDKDMPDNSVKGFLYAKEANFWLKTISSVLDATAHAHDDASPFRQNPEKSCDDDGNCEGK